MRVVRLANSAVNHLQSNHINGDVVACGIGHGFSIAGVASAFRANSDIDRDLHLYDKYWSPNICQHSKLHERLCASQYPADRIFYHHGILDDMLSQGAVDRIALLLLNVRHWQTARAAIELFFPRLTRNGVLLIESDHASIADYFRSRKIYFPLQLREQRARIGVHHLTP